MALLGLYSSVKQQVGNIILSNSIGDIGTIADTLLTDLKTFTLPKNTMSNNGDIIEIECIYTTAANGNTKNIFLKLVSTNLASVSGTFNNVNIRVRIVINRISATSQLCIGLITTSGITTIASTIASTTSDLTTDLIIKAQGQNGTAAANDIVCKQMSVRYFENI